MNYNSRNVNYNGKNQQYRNDNYQRRRFKPYEAKPSGNDHRQTNLGRKVNDFIDSVKRSHSFGDVVLCLKCDEHPYVSLQNSLNPLNIPLNFIKEPDTSTFILRAGNEELARGDFPSQREAKIALAWFALDKLHKICFAIIRKDYYHEVKDEKLRASSLREQKSDQGQTAESSEAGHQTPNTTISTSDEVVKGKEIVQDSLSVESSSLVGSKAFNMMLKMGWRGSGLGVQEQGITQSILVNENIDRQGLGHEGKGDITSELRNLLVAYSRSNKLSALAFSKDFTKEEREMIHKFCQTKLRNLKTKSVGRGEDRYLTVTRKITKMEMVAELIRIGGENEFYKLIIPDNFKDSYENLFGNSSS